MKNFLKNLIPFGVGAAIIAFCVLISYSQVAIGLIVITFCLFIMAFVTWVLGAFVMSLFGYEVD